MNFVESLNQMTQDALDEDIKDHLLQMWVDSLADEGPEYMEWKLMYYASDELKRQYNEYYNLAENDEYYFTVSPRETT